MQARGTIPVTSPLHTAAVSCGSKHTAGGSAGAERGAIQAPPPPTRHMWLCWMTHAPLVAGPGALDPPVHPLELGQQRVDVVTRGQQRQRRPGICSSRGPRAARAASSSQQRVKMLSPADSTLFLHLRSKGVRSTLRPATRRRCGWQAAAPAGLCCVSFSALLFCSQRTRVVAGVPGAVVALQHPLAARHQLPALLQTGVGAAHAIRERTMHMCRPRSVFSAITQRDAPRLQPAPRA